ncbi:MAG: hypothetical protein IKJ65_06120 [Clostridia bacterium]|nr:hypothetical protein [Clostridia bacterium]
MNISQDALSDKEIARFKEVYCGVCRALRLGEGHLCHLALSYDFAFLGLLLNALYEPEETRDEKRCAPHPKKKQPYAISKYVEYAADMNVLLYYFSALDGWMDDKNYLKLAFSHALKKRALSVKVKYPRQANAIETELRKLSEIEKARLNDLDAAASCFGRLLSEVFVPEEDVWSRYLGEMGFSLGRFIYFIDAWDDAEKDEKAGSYNPLLAIKASDDYEETVKRILTLEIAQCAMAFEKLPIVTDANILRNILYSGVWTKYYKSKEEQSKGKEKDQ